MNNLLIRKTLKQTGMKYWQLARLLGISEATLTRRLRDELPVEEQKKIVAMIEAKTIKREDDNTEEGDL